MITVTGQKSSCAEAGFKFDCPVGVRSYSWPRVELLGEGLGVHLNPHLLSPCPSTNPFITCRSDAPANVCPVSCPLIFQNGCSVSETLN